MLVPYVDAERLQADLHRMREETFGGNNRILKALMRRSEVATVRCLRTKEMLSCLQCMRRYVVHVSFTVSKRTAGGGNEQKQMSGKAMRWSQWQGRTQVVDGWRRPFARAPLRGIVRP